MTKDHKEPLRVKSEDFRFGVNTFLSIVEIVAVKPRLMSKQIRIFFFLLMLTFQRITIGEMVKHISLTTLKADWV